MVDFRWMRRKKDNNGKEDNSVSKRVVQIDFTL